VLSIALLPLALAGYLLAAARRRRGWFPVWIVGVAAGVAVLSRIGLLALVDSTSFPAAQTLYALPAADFLLLFLLTGTWLLMRSRKPTNGSTHAPREAHHATPESAPTARAATTVGSDQLG
jgi:cell shape-determining protein MreD